jgi:hypothetical protein
MKHDKVTGLTGPLFGMQKIRNAAEFAMGMLGQK